MGRKPGPLAGVCDSFQQLQPQRDPPFNRSPPLRIGLLVQILPELVDVLPECLLEIGWKLRGSIAERKEIAFVAAIEPVRRIARSCEAPVEFGDMGIPNQNQHLSMAR